jgi:hypothetical protein
VIKEESKSKIDYEYIDLLKLHKYTRQCLRKIIEKKRLTLFFIDNKERTTLINETLLKGFF